MNQLTAYLLTEAIINSLVVGAICYIALKFIVTVFKNIPAIYKYHLGNIALLIPLFSFVRNLPELFTTNTSAPVNDIVPVASETVATLPTPAQVAPSEQLEVSATLWESINNILQAYSNEILVCYLIGLLLFTIRLSLQYVESRKLKATATLPVSEHWQQLLNSTKQQLNITGNVVLAFTEKNISPCIIGHAKAMILLPVSLANNLSTEQAEAILLHELAHYKQYDHYINLITQCINCILFFNPFTWLISKEAYKHRELACDDVAAKRNRNIELAETLVMIANIKTAENTVALNLKKSPLFNRVQTLLKMNNDQKSSPKFLSLGILTIVLSTALVLFSNTELFSQKKSNDLTEQLTKISEQLYEEGNTNYIVVDAVLDSVVTLPAKLEILYLENDQFFIHVNSKQIELTTEQTYKYATKLENLIARDNAGQSTTFSARIQQTVTIDDILNPQSWFRTTEPEREFGRGLHAPQWKKLLQHMVDDGLIDLNRKEDIVLQYAVSSGIKVYGQPLTESNSNKYKKLFKELVFVDLDKGNESGQRTYEDLRKLFPEIGNSEIIEANSSIMSQEELRALSKKLFDEANQDYIIIDAIADGYLKEGEDFTVRYKRGFFSIKDKNIPPLKRQEYEQKLQNFEKQHGERYNMWGELSSTVNLTAIKNGTHSMFKIVIPKPLASVDRPQSEHPQNGNLILQEIFKDKLARKDTVLKVVYLGNDVFLNGKFLQGEAKDKYLKLFYEQFGYWDLPIMLTHTSTQKNSIPTEDNTDTNTPTAEYEEYHNKILEEIYKDKLARPDSLVKLTYVKKEIVVNEQWLKGDVRDKYLQLLEEKYGDLDSLKPFIKLYNINFKANNSLDDYYKNSIEKEYEKNSDKIVEQIFEDKLAKRKNYLHLLYTGDSVYVNLKPLSAQMNSKYVLMFQQQYGPLEEGSNGIKITRLETDNLNNIEWSTATEILSKMAGDNLVDLKRTVVVSYTGHNVYIDYVPLEGSMKTKYLNIFQSIFGDLDKEQLPLEIISAKKNENGMPVTNIVYRKNALQDIMQEMFAQGNMNFIVLKALNDGLIKEGKRYSFSYRDDTIKIGGVRLPRAIELEYSQLIRKFHKTHRINKHAYGSMRSGGVKLDDILNSKSGFRKYRAYAPDPINGGRHIKSEKITDRAIGMMVKDGVLDTTQKYHVKYNYRGITVNGKKLDEEQAEKYLPMFRAAHGSKPRFLSSDGISIMSNK